MRNPIPQPALLPHLAGMHLPPMALAVSAQYQFAVDCGAAAAVGFFDDVHAVTLHAHLPASLACFLQHIRLGAAALGMGPASNLQPCTDAFCAGYLGRIQQELRLLHGEGSSLHGTSRDAGDADNAASSIH